MSNPEESRQSTIRTLAENLDVARCRRGITQKDLCKRAEITQQTYRRLMSGEEGVAIGVVLRLMQVLEVEGLFGNPLDPAIDKVGIEMETVALANKHKPMQRHQVVKSSTHFKSDRYKKDFQD